MSGAAAADGVAVDFGGIAPVSEGSEEGPPATSVGRGPGAFGAPSAELSLVGVRPRRARLRFTRRRQGNGNALERQEQGRELGLSGQPELVNP